MTTRRGLYLALEGAEGAGKSTVADVLVRELRERGHSVTEAREPGGTALGESIRELLLHSSAMTPWAEAALFAAQRAQLVSEVVAPALAAGRWVVSDRSYYSSLAYQGVGRGLGLERVRAINEVVLDGVVPDLIFVLDVDPHTGLERQMEPDRIGQAGIEFQIAVAAAYHSLAEAEPERVILVEGTRTPDESAQRIAEIAERRWSR